MTGRYEKARDDLPWGWWLRATAAGVEDPDGGLWPDVRTAFWKGRLGMKSTHVAGEQQELLLRVLTAISGYWVTSSERKIDLFGGDMMFWHFYMCWLGSVGLTSVANGASALQAPLSEEGRAVMLMLRATRDPAWADLPVQDVIDAVGRADWDAADDDREAALRAFERGMTQLRHLFARERAGRAHLVTLTSIDPRDRMPMRRVAWSASFLDERGRDDLFGWLATRVHRWEDWGGIARDRGAKALTAHFLCLLVESPIGGTGPAGSGRAGGGS